ncbi:MAG: hypothetical protein EOO48_05505 [Flavobacterium sp.]|nr:MAG: hypothetical protein EOO48_05505 [Flavobacterium sp.]
MKKIFAIIIFFIGLSSFTAHKFYVSIYQINYSTEKKMLQITSRIFIDDLNSALSKKYHRPFHLGEKEQTADDLEQMKQYFSANFQIKANGIQKPIQYMSSEMENNVLICYFRITEIPSVKSLEITNKILFDTVTEQQNIIQTNVGGVKKSLLLTSDNPSDTIKF